MPISFKDSKKQLLSDKVAAVRAAPVKIATAPVMTIAEVPEGFTVSDKYPQYEKYEDNTMSYIDSERRISVDNSQINLTQETNSQLIPFQMPRYTEGIDLMDMTLQIHFVNSENRENYVTPVNVSYNDTTIRFAWLVDDSATYISGKLDFEIIAVGENEKGERYVWKSRSNGNLIVEKSLSADGVTEPTVALYEYLLAQIDVLNQELTDFKSGDSIFAIDGGDAFFRE